MFLFLERELNSHFKTGIRESPGVPVPELLRRTSSSPPSTIISWSRTRILEIKLRVALPGGKPVLTYKITRKSAAPNGRLLGPSQYTLGKDGAVTGIKYKGKAREVRYKVNGTLINTVSVKSIFSISTKAKDLSYTATTAGNYTFAVEELNSCGDWFSTLSKTVYVTPSCAGDDPDNIAFGISGSDVEVLDNGYRVNNGGNYTINIAGVTDFDDNYTLSHNGGEAIQLSGRNFTVNSEVGSYRLEATPTAGRSGCTVLNPIKFFVGGQDRVFPARGQFYNCSIVLPNQALLTELGYETDEYQNYILKHFSLTLRSKKAIIIKPGVILESGAQLIVEGSKPRVDDADPDKNINFIEQIAYDEYRNVIRQTRAYFDERGRPLQRQYKNLTENVAIASATLYDAYGRAVISTLPAPINSYSAKASVDECGEVIAGGKGCL